MMFFSFYVSSKQTVTRTLHMEPSVERYNSTILPHSGSSHFSGSLDVANAKDSKPISAQFESTDSQNLLPPLSLPIFHSVIEKTSETENTVCIEPEIKPLTHINVSLQDIKPGTRYSYIYFLIKIIETFLLET